MFEANPPPVIEDDSCLQQSDTAWLVARLPSEKQQGKRFPKKHPAADRQPFNHNGQDVGRHNRPRHVTQDQNTNAATEYMMVFFLISDRIFLSRRR